MGWSTDRKPTDEELHRLEVAATAFLKRHRISGMPGWANWEVCQAIKPDDPDDHDGKRLRALWRRIMRRALRHPSADGIAYGYIGWQTD